MGEGVGVERCRWDERGGSGERRGLRALVRIKVTGRFA